MYDNGNFLQIPTRVVEHTDSSHVKLSFSQYGINYDISKNILSLSEMAHNLLVTFQIHVPK